jgi:hypothetical protein
MGLGTGGPLLVEPAGLLSDGSRLAEQDGITSHAEDEIGEAPLGKDLNDLWGGEVTVATAEDMGSGPVAPQRGQEPDQDHRVFRADRTPPRTEAGGYSRMRRPFENDEGQIAIALVVLVIEGELLLPRR